MYRIFNIFDTIFANFESIFPFVISLCESEYAAVYRKRQIYAREKFRVLLDYS